MSLAKIRDKIATMGVLDSLFIATNYDEQDNSNFNDQKTLVRYEFFEIMVRVAKLKFISRGKLDETQNAKALHRLFNEHLLPILSLK